MTVPSKLPPLGWLRTFDAAARHLSFSRAAQELHVTPAAVSQQLRALEDALGVALFERLTRAVRLTEAGLAMQPRVAEGLALLAAAVEAARAPAQVLRLAAPPSLASHWLLPRLDDFDARHPGIELRLSGSSDAVDPQGAAPGPAALHGAGNAAEGTRLAILYGTGPWPGWQAQALFTPQLLPVCVPALARALQAPADLARCTLIHDETLRGGRGWPRWLQAAGLGPATGARHRRLSHAGLALDAALAGQGVALAARALVAPQLAAGTLAAPFALAVPSPFTYWLVLAPRLASQPAVQALRQWLMAQATAEAG